MKKLGYFKLNNWVVVLIFAILVATFFWKTIFLGHVTIPADILKEWYPWKAAESLEYHPHNTVMADAVNLIYPFDVFAGQSIKNRDLPLWNPYIFSGTPFMANIHSLVFYPLLMLLRFLFSPALATQLCIMVHLFLMGLCMYLLMRRFRLAEFPSLISGLIWMFNGHIIVWLTAKPIIIGGALFPMLFLSFKKSLDGGNYFYSLLSGIILGLILLSGFYTAYYILIFLFLYFVFIVFTERKRISKYLLLFLITVAIGISLAMAQLLPTVEFFLNTSRGPRLLAGLFSSSALTKYLLLPTFFIPKLFGDPTYPNTFLFAGNLFNEFQGYMGVLPLILAIFAAVYIRNKYVSFFAGTAILALLLSFKTPIYLLFYYILPWFNRIETGRILFMYAFSISVLAGFGINYILSEQKIFRHMLRFCKLLAILFVLSITCFGILNIFSFTQKGRVIQLISSHFKTKIPPHLIYANISNNIHILNPTMLTFILVFGLSILVFYLFAKRILIKGIFKIAVFGLIVFDLFSFGINYNTNTSPALLYPKMQCLELLQNDKTLFRVMSLNDKGWESLVMPFSTKMPYFLQDIGGYDVLYPKYYAEFMQLVRDNNAVAKPAPFNYHYILLSNYNSKLIDLLNVKYIITAPDKLIEDKRFQLVYTGSIRIYKNNSCLPRAFLVPCAITLKSKNEVFEMLSDSKFDPTRKAILEDKAPVTKCTDNKDSLVQIISYRPNQVDIITKMQDEGFLVLTDSYYPGWQVYVDGKKDKIYRAYYALRAVYLPEGKHKVQFVYRPRSFLIGRNISIAAIIFIIGIFILAWLRKLLK